MLVIKRALSGIASQNELEQREYLSHSVHRERESLFCYRRWWELYKCCLQDSSGETQALSLTTFKALHYSMAQSM